MKEIGGYFGLEQLISKEYYPDLIKLNNARNALLYLLKARNIRKLYIPYYLCDSVSNLCDRYGYPYEYYHIGSNFHPIFEKALADDEYLYVVNFYGQISNEQVVQLRERYHNIIFDNVQAFFQRPVNGIDTIYSCRKFFGVPDGGYLATEVRLPELMGRDSSRDRMKHILGRYEGCASDYYADFKKSDAACATSELLRMSALTENFLGAIDYEAIRQIRNENYMFLARHLEERNGLLLTAPDGPYCYPFYCENGMEIKKRLAEEKIYVATLWPNVLKLSGTFEENLARNILPLPCDQRYSHEDMERIVNTLEAIMALEE